MFEFYFFILNCLRLRFQLLLRQLLRVSHLRDKFNQLLFDMTVEPLTGLPIWKKLEADFKEFGPTLNIKSLFLQNPGRFKTYRCVSVFVLIGLI